MSCDNSFDLIDYRLNEEVVIVISVYEVSQYHARGNLIAFKIRYLCDKMFHSKKSKQGLVVAVSHNSTRVRVWTSGRKYMHACHC